MEIFAKILQGPYAYLLVLQVLIVSGLLLTLIYLILLRMRETPFEVVATEMPLARVAAPPAPVMEAPVAAVAAVPESASPAPIPPVDTTPVVAPNLTIAAEAAPPPPSTPAPSPIDMQALNNEKERARGLEHDSAVLRDKVRYLESKLLEYEILQEEIGALSSLKLENERLRQELMQSKQARPAPPPPAAPEMSPVAVSPSPPAAEISTPEPPPAASFPPSPLSTFAPGSSPDAPSPELSGATDDSARSVLDGLLKQIEELTGDSAGGKKS